MNLSSHLWNNRKLQKNPEKPTVPPSTDDIINFKIGDTDMIVGTIHGMELPMVTKDMQS